MAPVEVVRAYWAAIEAHDWAAVGQRLAQDVVVDWPASGERIRGRANVVAVNREYPEGWSIRVLRLVAQAGEVVSEVEVPQAGVGTFRAASFWTVDSGQIVAGREYWTGVGADDAPGWRRAWVERVAPPPVP